MKSTAVLLRMPMVRSSKKMLVYLFLIVLAMGLIWYFQLEEEHELKSRLKSFLRAVT